MAMPPKPGGVGKLLRSRDVDSVENPSPDRFQSPRVIRQDSYDSVLKSGGGAVKPDLDTVGARDALVLFLAFAEPSSPEDLKQAHAPQDAIQITLAAPGKLALPERDQATWVATRNRPNELAQGVRNYPWAFRASRGGRSDPAPDGS